MKQSQLFGKTQKEIPSGITSENHKLLYRAGFIRESVAGRYYFLPLGIKVHEKISKIIENKMDSIGAQKILTPTLHPLELWKETARTETTGFELMIIEDRRGSEFALGGTAEEMVVDLVRKFNISYKDLPFNLYQFSNKFRDEMRARGGLLRTREFIMKDSYSFHKDEKEFSEYYEMMSKLYYDIFKEIGLETLKVEADNGYIGGDYCHEYIVESQEGESRFFSTEDNSYLAHEDVAKFSYEEMNKEEHIKDMELVNLPEEIQTMKQLSEHYKMPYWRFLKNVVYKNNRTGKIVIVVIRGDLEVNKTKVESLLGMVEQLEDASTEDLQSFGSKTGYVHSWGYEDKNIIFLADNSLKTVKNMYGGQKTEKTDPINVNYGRDFKHEIEGDFAIAKEGLVSPNGKKIVEKKGIEVGNIFQLGYHYSSKMNATFRDEKGVDQKYYMGCYGIGIGRTMATVAEIFRDDKGIIWPESIAPFKIHLISLGENEKAEEIYNDLIVKGIEVLYDDRDSSAGSKLADSDLIGIPYRVVISSRSLSNGGVEVKKRSEEESRIVPVDEILNSLK